MNFKQPYLSKRIKCLADRKVLPKNIHILLLEPFDEIIGENNLRHDKWKMFFFISIDSIVINTFINQS